MCKMIILISARHKIRYMLSFKQKSVLLFVVCKKYCKLEEDVVTRIEMI